MKNFYIDMLDFHDEADDVCMVNLLVRGAICL
jgi:hypothetical protein